MFFGEWLDLGRHIINMNLEGLISETRMDEFVCIDPDFW